MHGEGQLDLRIHRGDRKAKTVSICKLCKTKGHRPRPRAGFNSSHAPSGLLGNLCPAPALEENVPGPDLPLVADNDARPLNHVFQLSDVSRPVVLFESLICIYA